MTMIRNRAILQGSTGLPGLFTAYFSASSPPTVAEATEASARVRAFWEAVKASLSPAVTISYTGVCDEIDPTDGSLQGTVVGTNPVSTVGTATGNPLPLGTMIRAIYNSNVIVRGRRVRGSAFIGPCMQVDLAPLGAPGGTLTTRVTAAGTALGTTIVTPLAHVIWSRPVKDPVSHALLHAGSACAVNSYQSSLIFTMLRTRRS